MEVALSPQTFQCRFVQWGHSGLNEASAEDMIVGKCNVLTQYLFGKSFVIASIRNRETQRESEFRVFRWRGSATTFQSANSEEVIFLDIHLCSPTLISPPPDNEPQEFEIIFRKQECNLSSFCWYKVFEVASIYCRYSVLLSNKNRRVKMPPSILQQLLQGQILPTDKRGHRIYYNNEYSDSICFVCERIVLSVAGKVASTSDNLNYGKITPQTQVVIDYATHEENQQQQQTQRDSANQAILSPLELHDPTSVSILRNLYRQCIASPANEKYATPSSTARTTSVLMTAGTPDSNLTALVHALTDEVAPQINNLDSGGNDDNSSYSFDVPAYVVDLSVARLLREKAVCLGPDHVLAFTGGGFGGRDVLELDDVRRALNIAWALQPCVVLFDSLELIAPPAEAPAPSLFMTPQTSGNDKNESPFEYDKETQRNVIKMLREFIYRTREEGRRVLVVGICGRFDSSGNQISGGCVGSGFNGVNATLLDAFDNKLFLPLPSSRRKRGILRAIAKKILSRLNDIVTAFAGHHKTESTRNNSILQGCTHETAKHFAELVAHIDIIRWAEIFQASSMSAPAVSQAALSQLMGMLQSIDLPVSLYHSVIPMKSDALLKSKSPSLELLRFEGVVGHAQAKQQLTEAITWPRKYAHIYRRFNIHPEVGVLLYGPPGTGKTLIPAVIARELRCAFVSIRITDIVHGTLGSGEKVLVSAFQEARRAAPSIIFIDEFQAMFTSRAGQGQTGAVSDADAVGSSLTSALSSCFDDLASWNVFASVRSTSRIHSAGTAVNDNEIASAEAALKVRVDEEEDDDEDCGDRVVTVIAATNEPWAVDRGFLRPGRLDRVIFVGPLEAQGRLDFLSDWFRVMRLKLEALMVTSGDPSGHSGPTALAAEAGATVDELDAVVQQTAGFTGADMRILVDRACGHAIAGANGRTQASKDTVNATVREMHALFPRLEHFREALVQMEPSVTQKELDEYMEWAAII